MSGDLRSRHGPGWSRSQPSLVGLAPYGATVLAAAAVFVLAFPDRLDYASHVVAGFALAVAGVTVLERWVSSAPAIAVTAVVIAVAAPASEVVLFGPGLDWIDVANTWLGAAMGLGVVLRFPVPASARPALLVACVVAGVAALVLRYSTAAGPSA